MEQIPEEDPLQTFEERVELPDHYSPHATHLKTYTAGEDESRLQQAARELGLQQARQNLNLDNKYGNNNIDAASVIQKTFFIYY